MQKNSPEIYRRELRDEILAASVMFFEVKGIILPSGVATLFGFNATTVRSLIKNHKEYYEIKNRSRIIATPTRLLERVGSALAQHYGLLLLQRVETRSSKLRAAYHGNPNRILPAVEELLRFAPSLLQYWRTKLYPR